MFEYLCETNALISNPVEGVKRQKMVNAESKTPAVGNHQMRVLLTAPDVATLQGKLDRDRVILSTLLYYGLRRDELCALMVGDVQSRRGVMHLRINSKGGKLCYVLLHPSTAQVIDDYLQTTGHAGDAKGALFRPVKTVCQWPRIDHGRRRLEDDGRLCGISENGHRRVPNACAARHRRHNAPDHEADIAKVQD